MFLSYICLQEKIPLCTTKDCFVLCCPGKGGVQLRPPSPFIPVCNVMEREVNQTCMNEADKYPEKYIKGVNPFSSIGKLKSNLYSTFDSSKL